MKNQKFRSIIALALTVILAFAVFIPILRVPASAEALNNCYYFSDYAPCMNFYNAEIVGNFDHHWLYYYPGDTFEEDFAENYTNGAYDSISNAYVIFEIRNGLTTVDSSSSYPVLFHIIDFFAELKSRGCKIMFISGTHTVRMVGYEYALLRNVDVHVDVAVWDRFVMTILYEIWNSNNYMDDTTIILDEYLSRKTENNEVSNFTHEYIFPFIRSLYKDEMPAGYDEFKEFLEDKNIKVIHYEDDNYYDPFSENSADISGDATDFFDLVNNEHIYAIGSTLSDPGTILIWLNDMISIPRTNVRNIPIYMYNANYGTEFISNYQHVKFSPRLPDVTNIMLAFISEDTGALENYDNDPNGISDITYNFLRGIGSGSGNIPDIGIDFGMNELWLRDFVIAEFGFPIDWYQVVMNRSTYDYFFNYDSYPEDIIDE